MTGEIETDALEGSGLDGSEGVFWIDGGPRVPGTLHYRNGELRIVTQGIARTPRSLEFGEDPGSRWMSMSLDPADAVADFAPIPLLGTLGDGRLITVIDGRLITEPQFDVQSLSGTRVLLGAHAPTVATTFIAARVALPQADLWRGVFASPSAYEFRLGERAGRLRAVVDGDLGWLELTLDSGLVQREWERRFWGRCLTLLRLWSHAELREDRVQLSPAGDGSWVDLLHAGIKRSERITARESLLAPGSLSLDMVAAALALFDELAPVPDVASKDMAHRVTLELAVLANAAAIEGLHRGTPGGVVPFPAMKKSRPIGKAAAKAAAALAAEQGVISPEQVPAMISRLTGPFALVIEQPFFAERLDQMLPLVEQVAPGLIGTDRKAWIEAVVRARNLEAHRFVPKPEQRLRHEEHVDDYYVLAVSTEWVLRISLLLRLGVPPDRLHGRLLDHQQFEFALANMDHSESPPGSRLAEFRASRESHEPRGPQD